MRLSDVWAGRESVQEVADYAAHLPRGGAVGEWFGGELAISAQVQAQWEANYYLALAVTDKPKKVKPRPMPDGVRDVTKKRNIAMSKAERYKARRMG